MVPKTATTEVLLLECMEMIKRCELLQLKTQINVGGKNILRAQIRDLP